MMDNNKAATIAFNMWMDEQDAQWGKPLGKRNWNKTDVLFKRYMFLANIRNHAINNAWKNGL